MIYNGEIRNGVIVLDPTDSLPEGSKVRVEVLPAPSAMSDDDLLGMLEFAGDAGVTDLATNIDHHLYGHPKVADDAQ